MIGKICVSTFPYYDSVRNKKSFKKRPVLVIGGPRNHDYTVLPISSVSKSENIDAEFDVKVTPQSHPELQLNKVSYIRVHKQTTVHESDIRGVIADMRTDSEELYLGIMEKLEVFNALIVENSL